MVEGNIEITRKNQPEKIRATSQGIEIRRQGRPVSGEIEGRRIVFLVIDCSGSMSGEKLVQAKQGAIDFASDARPKGYSIGLIQFGSDSTQICEPQRDLAALRGYVERLAIAGSTNMAAGINLATEELGQGMASRAIVLVTDGHPDSRASALDAASRAKRRGIDIITIGTKDADQRLLKELASRTNLSVTVSDNQLREGIASTATMLPSA